MILHNIDIHLFMPAGIDSPGFVEEEKEKPAVTKKIEESDEQISPEKCAEYLIAGAYISSLLCPPITSFESVSIHILTLPSSLFGRSLTLVMKLNTRPRLARTDSRGRKGLLSIYIPSHRGIDQGGIKRFSTWK